MRQHLIIFTLVLAGGCVDDAPATPTFRQHVEPILRADCAYCHDGVGHGGAPPSFRLDVLEDTTDPVTGQYWRGARTMAPFIAERAGRLGQMPPGGPELNDRQRGILENWAATGLGLGDVSQNHPPTIVATISQAGELVTVDYRISDGDGDRVRGFVAVDDAAVVPLGAALHAGQDRVTFSTRTLAPGSYVLRARLFDNYSGEDADGVGGPDGIVSDGLGSVAVVHANTAPHAFVQAPAPDQLFAPNDHLDESCAGPQCIALVIRDCLGPGGESCTSPDGPETYAVTITAFRADQTVPVAVVADLPAGANAIAWDPLSLLGPGTSWRLRFAISDGSTSTTVESRPFIVGGGATTLTFAADIKPIIDSTCAPCHQPGGRHTTSFFTYDGNPESLRSLAGPAYRRVVEWEIMPLVSGQSLDASPPITAEQRRLIGEWLTAGGQ
jgi:hypothetical protein